MTFLNPAILFGLLAISLPVAIHLLSKPRLKRIKWAATKFLLQSMQKNRRRVQMEDVLLLLLRALLVALLVVLFARPAFLVDAGLELGGFAAPAVIIIDNSMSMGQSDGVQTRFNQAKAMADDLLARLQSGSSCALYLSSNQVKAVIPKPTGDLAIVKRFIDQAPLTDGGSDLYPALKQAVDLLKGLSGAHKEIFVLTDSQEAAWTELGKIRGLQEENARDINLQLLPVGDHGEDNLAVSALQLAGTVAAVNQPLRCAITVNNWGRSAADHIPVKLATDNNAPEDQGMIDHLDPGAAKIISLTAHFHDPGYHSLTASIPGDRLPDDDQRSTALLVLDRLNLLVVEGTGKPDPTARDGFFLSHALMPVSHTQAAQYYVRVLTSPTSVLESPSISENQAIFLCNVRQLSPRGAQNLHDYVNRGGALVVFPGPTTDINYANSDPLFSPLLPATLGHATGPPAGQATLGWQSKGYQHPVVTLWNQPESGTLGTVRTTHYFPLTPKTAVDAAHAPQVIVNYADGEPAVVEQTVGKGKVVLFSSTATTDWTTLPIHPSFVPLLSRLVSYVTGVSGGNLNLIPGDAFSRPVDNEFAGRELSVQRPGDTKKHLVGTIEAGEQSAFLRYADTEIAGPYRLFIGDDAKPAAVFAVQSDPAESNLAQQPPTDLEPLLHPAPPFGTGATAAAGDDSAASHRIVPGQELGFVFAILALVVVITDTVLSQRFSRSK